MPSREVVATSQRRSAMRYMQQHYSITERRCCDVTGNLRSPFPLCEIADVVRVLDQLLALLLPGGLAMLRRPPGTYSNSSRAVGSSIMSDEPTVNRDGKCRINCGPTNFLWLSYLVPGAGLEPARPCGQRILSPLRLPIPPPGLPAELSGIDCGVTTEARRNYSGKRDMFTRLLLAAISFHAAAVSPSGVGGYSSSGLELP